MSLFELLVVPEALFGTLLGVVGALLVHWLAPAPEPVTVEAGLVALGFIAGLGLNRWNHRAGKDVD